MKKRGFTLIELLVVIAIIGILAAIVLVSLGGARDKARNARIQADISQARAAAEIYYNDNNYSYGNGTDLCTAADIALLIGDMATQSGGTVVCDGNGDAYCISSPLVGGGNVCVSAAGQVGNDPCVIATTLCTP